MGHPIKNWAKDQSRHFAKEGVQATESHMTRRSTSLAIKEVQIKAPARGPFLPLLTDRMATAAVGRDVTKPEL